MGVGETRTQLGRTTVIALILLAAATGAGLRLWNVGTQPLWLDEAYSAYAISKDFNFLWHVVPKYETHPPFFYTLLWFWTKLFGDSLVALRAMGVLCGMLSIGVVTLAAQELSRQLHMDAVNRRRLVIAVFFLILFAPMLVQMSREVRPYASMILVYGAAITALFRLSQQMANGRGLVGGSYASYLVTLALMLWLHNLGALYGAALGLAMLTLCLRRGWSRRDWFALIIGHAVVFILWLPALAILADQAPTWIKSTWVTFPPQGFGTRLTMLFVAPTITSLLSALLLIGFAIAALYRGDRNRRALIALLILAMVPIFLSVALSALFAPVFILRTMTPVGVPALLLLALGFATAQGRRRWLAAAALLIIIVQMITVCINSRMSPPPEQWHAVVRWLKVRMKPGDIVLTYPNEGSLPFDRAVGDLGAGIASHPVPVAVPAIGVGGWYPTGSRGVVSMPRDRLRTIAESRTIQSAPTIWLIRMGPWAYDRGDVFLNELNRGRDKVGDLRTGVIDVTGFHRRKAAPQP